MAKLTSFLTLDGSLAGLTIYRLPGVDKPIVRATRGPSKDDIAHKPQYALTRRNNSEHGGRSRAVSGLMKAFQPLKPLADFDTAGHLNKLLRAVQVVDTGSPWGERAVRLSRHPQLIEGFHLTKAAPFDTVVRGEVAAQVDRSTLEASVALPALLPGLTFFPPQGYAYCRLVATLGVAPDVVFDPLGWTTEGDYTNCFALATHTEWFAAAKGCGATTLSLRLPYTLPTGAFALVLTVAVQLGMPGSNGAIEPVRKRAGSAKILVAV